MASAEALTACAELAIWPAAAHAKTRPAAAVKQTLAVGLRRIFGNFLRCQESWVEREKKKPAIRLAFSGYEYQ
jgi:hypothetical protein